MPKRLVLRCNKCGTGGTPPYRDDICNTHMCNGEMVLVPEEARLVTRPARELTERQAILMVCEVAEFHAHRYPAIKAEHLHAAVKLLRAPKPPRARIAPSEPPKTP